MKRFIVAGLMLSSLQAFSQSYLVLNNGVTLTTDSDGFVYDFGNFNLPYKVTTSGGQFLVANEKLSTIDSAGFIYEKSIKIGKVKAKGLNYLVTDRNVLVTVDSKGFAYEFEKDAATVKKAVKFGGNYLLVKPEDRKPLVELYTVNANGNYNKVEAAGVDPADITTIGGKFFQTKDGVVHTVSDTGFVFSKKDMKVGNIAKKGGNYFISAANLIYTFSDDGILFLPALPKNFKAASINKLGANYMIDMEGRIYTVDKAGNLFERTVKHDLRETKILSL